MKKFTIILALIVLLFLLMACGTKSSSSTAANAIMAGNELALGILHLEGTSQAVNSETASQLLPLWQLLDELDANTSAAPQEITAVVDSIRASMTAQQLKAINDMQLTELQVVLAAQGGGMEGITGSTLVSSTASALTTSGITGQNIVFTGEAGGPPPGGITDRPNGGGKSQQNTLTSKSSSGTGSTSLIQQVITLLQHKIQG